VQSGHDLVRSQSPQALGIGSPISGRIGGDTPIVVEVYALGRGVTLERQGCNLLAGQGTFELEAHGKVFVFDPLSAIHAHRLVPPVEGNVGAVFQALQAVNQENLAEFGRCVGHIGFPLKTTILMLEAGMGKTTIAKQLADHLGCTTVIDEWNWGKPLTLNALHLTNTIATDWIRALPSMVQDDFGNLVAVPA
jgi:hypothetical protein